MDRNANIRVASQGQFTKADTELGRGGASFARCAMRGRQDAVELRGRSFGARCILLMSWRTWWSDNHIAQ
jgi:hypothetical protein